MNIKIPHTPAPWVVVALDPENDSECARTGYARLQIQTRPDEEHIAERSAICDVLYKFGSRGDWEEAAANARLIAASPDLLREAKVLLESGLMPRQLEGLRRAVEKAEKRP